ncbi:MAG: FkbM family methyltransferase [Alphaproteobacteria bacterium]|nr:FkbM family methyltransferase [Alphaproteobacteria bacterium]
MTPVTDALALLLRGTLGDEASIARGADLLRLVEALGQRRDDADVRAFAGFCRLFLRAFENCNYDMATNGEAWLLGCLAPLRPRVVLDVGANVGDWSALAAATLPGAAIHAFEIVPDTFRRLQQRAAALGGRVVANPFGLSDRAGEVEVNVVPDDSTLSSVVKLHEAATRTVACPVMAGDDYLDRAGIERVDLLKIDVEGAEHLVLAGFARALGAGRIDVIQFEYGQANILTKVLLHDYHQELEALGYVVGKLFPARIDFRAYRTEHEDFIGPNFVAVRRARDDVLAALGAS